MNRRILLLLAPFLLLAACSQAPAPQEPLDVVALAPSAGAADVALNADVTVTFGAATDAAAVAEVDLVLRSGGGDVAGTLTYDDATRTLRFDPDGLLSAATSYEVELASGLAPIDVAGLSGASAWTFSTVADDAGTPGEGETPSDDGGEGTDTDRDGDGLDDDVDPNPDDPQGDADGDGIPDAEDVTIEVPSVVGANPGPWSTADPSSDVRVAFDAPIDPASLDGNTIRVFEGLLGGLFDIWFGWSDGIDGTVSYDETTRELVFTPAAPMKPGTWHWVHLDVDLLDLDGDAITGEDVWLFRTAD
jgi:hypothetical protein